MGFPCIEYWYVTGMEGNSNSNSWKSEICNNLISKLVLMIGNMNHSYRPREVIIGVDGVVYMITKGDATKYLETKDQFIFIPSSHGLYPVSSFPRLRCHDSFVGTKKGIIFSTFDNVSTILSHDSLGILSIWYLYACTPGSARRDCVPIVQYL